MNEYEVAEKNMILKVRAGSYLYGTNTLESDEDYIGIFIPEEKYLLGLNKIEEVSKEDCDDKLYSLSKFAKLALDNNPNILELLFVDAEDVLYINDLGLDLLELKNSFLSQNIKHRFLGYAFSQKKKMVTKLENYSDIYEAHYYLVNNKHNENEIFLVDLLPSPLFERTKDMIKVGDISLPAAITIKKAINTLKVRIEKFGDRKELVTRYGFDTKFALHLIRLITEGITLLRKGTLKFPLPNASFLMDIRNGVYSLDKILDISDGLESIMERVYKYTKLPKKPDFSKINDFVIRAHKTKICSKQEV
uniref:Putative nucleotidyltransferase n=1 Tax=viral metagenome TaxID=1070528 RepID=A0A6M3IU62_9ZZZZ